MSDGLGPFELDPENIAEKRTVQNSLSQEHADILRVWRDGLSLQDARYNDKTVFALAALAMFDEEIRHRLVHETEELLYEFNDRLPVPTDFTVKFHDNTPETVHVVLPPRARELRDRPPALRELLRSRVDTLGSGGFGADDWNMTDLRDQLEDSGRYDVADPSQHDFP